LSRKTKRLVSYALNGKQGKRDDGESETFVVATPLVRRLTPTECERLQGLPDGWTDHGADSRRYAALGDAVTAPVAEWIGRRLMEHA
jgi:DNA (cytosine-5)-methyltransferase 1